MTIIITEHILSACAMLARTDYIKRHKKMGKVVYQNASQAAEIFHNKKKEIPPVIESATPQFIGISP